MINQAPQTTPASVLQSRAFASAPNYNQTAQNGTASLLNYGPSNVNADTLAGADLSKYMNPWTDSVINATLADLGHARDMGINANSSAATLGGGANGWASSRAGVADANTNDNFMRTFANTAAGLRQAGFQNAQQGAQFDIGNKFSADQFNANNANTAAGIRLGAAGQLGTQQQQAQDSLLNAGNVQYGIDQANNPQAANAQWLSNLATILGQLNPALYTSQATKGSGSSTTTSTPSLLDSLGSILQAAGAMGGGMGGIKLPMPSDRRLKKDATPIGYDARGNRWWSYRYLWDDADAPLRVGVMADEAPAHAVIRHSSGFDMVDYGAL